MTRARRSSWKVDFVKKKKVMFDRKKYYLAWKMGSWIKIFMSLFHLQNNQMSKDELDENIFTIFSCEDKVDINCYSTLLLTRLSKIKCKF